MLLSRSFGTVLAGFMSKRRVPIRGGNWNNGDRAGVSAVNLNNPRSNSNNNIGARPALVSKQSDRAGLRACMQH